MLYDEQPPLRTSPTILVIEDDPGDANLIRWQLQERDPKAFEVVIVHALEQAQHKVQLEGLRPDVILLDLNLPDSSGIEGIERCRRFSSAPVVVLTGLDDNSTIAQAIQQGADDYLHKGADGVTLRKSVRYAILRHQRDNHARIAATVFSHVSEGIVITDPHGIIIDVNESFSRITGYTRDEVIGKKPNLLKSGQHDPDFFSQLWETLLSDGHWHGEVWNRRKSGEIYVETLTITAVRDPLGEVQHYVGLFADITQHKEQQRQLEHIAHYDALTGLPNRVLLSDRLSMAIRHAERRNQRIALVYLDLDGFKTINDTYGHSVGDELLIQVSRRMQATMRESDTIARLGGDEFVAILADLNDIEASLPLYTRLLQAAAEPVHVGKLLLNVSASLGITFYPQVEKLEADQLLRQADQAMYKAKLAGKNTYHIFDADHDRSLRGHHESLERIRKALVEHEFVLYYQPKVNMRNGTVIGAEALIRWQHPKRGLLPPAVFLPVVEGHPLELDIDEWVMEQAFKQLVQWGERAVPISVNIGARQLQRPEFIERLHVLLNTYPQISPRMLEIEVLESSALGDITQIAAVIKQCRQLGLRFALDDFGTGYSTLTYLKRLASDFLKVDQSFINDMLDDPDDLSILQGVLGLATAFRSEAIAEGVETPAHGEMLLKLGYQLAQGYAIAHPMPATELPGWIDGWQNHPTWVGQDPLCKNGQSLIYASVVHRAWVNALDAWVLDERLELPPLDHHKCRFGYWLESDARQRYANSPLLVEIEQLHQRLHHHGERVVEHKQANNPVALHDALDALHLVRDKVLDTLVRLGPG